MILKTSSGYPTLKRGCNDRVACPDELPDFHDRQAAQIEWAALASLVSHSPVMRVSRDGGKTYPHKWVRELNPDVLLPMPAAVHLHDKHGCGRVLVLDLDQSAGTVADDYTGLAHTLDSLGASWFADASPSGGRHIYLPLTETVPHTVLADAARRLATQHPSIDPSPHYSADTGCIRPPGSVWKHGGHQRLITDLKDAIATATIGNPNHLLEALINDIPAQSLPSAGATVDVDVSAYVPTGRHHLSPRLAAIARTGLYDTNRYSSPSEARQAVITGAVRAGLARIEVIRRIETGIWPGLAGMYRRYTTGRRQALNRDWAKATTWLTTQSKKSVQSGTTSPKVTRGQLPSPSTHASLRRIEKYLRHTEPPATNSAARKRRYLLRALLAAAHQDGSLTVARGCRSLALASGIDHTKIPTILQALCAEESPLLRKVGEAHGRNAAVYELLPPSEVSSDVSPWAKGLPVYGMRPAFRVLGLTAADVYESLELEGGSTGRGIARVTGHSPTTVLEALALLHSHGLVSTETSGGNTVWSVTTPQDLADVAERLGAMAVVAALILRYRNERLIWWAWLTEQALRRQVEYISDEAMRPPLWLPDSSVA